VNQPSNASKYQRTPQAEERGRNNRKKPLRQPSAWGLKFGPIPNVVHLLESKGADLPFALIECKKVDAFSLVVASEPPVRVP